MSNPKKNTDKMELVETHNLLLSLKRLSNGKPYDNQCWKRALYHAVCMGYLGSHTDRQKIREALELP